MIDEDSSVSITSESNYRLPLIYHSRKSFKEDVKETAWDEEITLRSNAGMQISFANC